MFVPSNTEYRSKKFSDSEINNYNSTRIIKIDQNQLSKVILLHEMLCNTSVTLRWMRKYIK